jgi:hypothetical protein
VWAFAVEPADQLRTRLITRSTGGYEHLLVGRLLRLVLRPIHLGMQRQQLLNLKRRAETAAWATRPLCRPACRRRRLT